MSSFFATMERVGGGDAWGLFGRMSKTEGWFERLVKVFDDVFETVRDGEGLRLRRNRGWKRWKSLRVWEMIDVVLLGGARPACGRL